jgi:monolysocardiolipin acyltransferase
VSTLASGSGKHNTLYWSDSVFSAFFRYGQVLETFRGQGIYQPSVDYAIAKLNDGGWVFLILF